LAAALLSLPWVQKAAAQVPTVEIPTITVTGQADSGRTGTAQQGYTVDKTVLGPFGERKVQDLPYSINILSSDLAKDVGATSMPSLLKYLPSAAIDGNGPSGSSPNGGIGRPYTRGFYATGGGNTKIDGLNAWVPSLSAGAFERLEVLNGLTGAIYGASNPSGTFNYVSLRPTANANAEVTADYRRNSIFGTTVDANSGLLNSGLAFRVTAGYEGGDGWMSGAHSDHERDFENVAIDYHFDAVTTLEVNWLRSHTSEVGFPGQFYYSVNSAGVAPFKIPRPIDATNSGFGQPYYASNVEDNIVHVMLKHKFNSDWSMVVGGLYQVDNIYTPLLQSTLTDNFGGYSSYLTNQPVSKQFYYSNLAYLNGRFDAFGFLNEVGIGTNGMYSPVDILRTTPNAFLGSANVNAPVVYPIGAYNYSSAAYRAVASGVQNIVFNDTITLSRMWQIALAGSYDWLYSKSHNTAGQLTSSYNDSGFSPSASLIFKPIDNLMTYFTYASALQQGDIAPTTATNASQALTPYRSHQYEIGAKTTLAGLDFNVDIFRINRPYANLDSSNTYRIVGDQVNTGFEFFTSGRFLNDWTALGGFTFLDPRLQNTGVFTTNGKDMVGLPRFTANLLLQYDVPLLPGLTLGGNIHYVGQRAVDDANTQWIGAYATLDLVGSYKTRIYGHETTFRLNVNNVTNTRYWSTILPASFVGGGNGTYRLTPGVPLDVLASVSTKF